MKHFLQLPSSLRWCEDKYVYNDYIAEFWNSITGISLCIVAIYLCCNEQKKVNFSLNASRILLFIVGVGTILFHSTLLYIWQLFDEIPMLLIVIEYHKLLSITTRLFKFYNIIYMVIPIIISSYYINPKLQVFLFQGTLTIYILYILYILSTINNLLDDFFYNTLPICNSVYDLQIEKQKIIDYMETKKLLKKYNRIGKLILLFSLMIWNIDNHYCEYIKFYTGILELHAIWHITTSIGMYYCDQIMQLYITIFKNLNHRN